VFWLFFFLCIFVGCWLGFGGGCVCVFGGGGLCGFCLVCGGWVFVFGVGAVLEGGVLVGCVFGLWLVVGGCVVVGAEVW